MRLKPPPRPRPGELETRGGLEREGWDARFTLTAISSRPGSASRAAIPTSSNRAVASPNPWRSALDRAESLCQNGSNRCARCGGSSKTAGDVLGEIPGSGGVIGGAIGVLALTGHFREDRKMTAMS